MKQRKDLEDVRQRDNLAKVMREMKVYTDGPPKQKNPPKDSDDEDQEQEGDTQDAEVIDDFDIKDESDDFEMLDASSKYCCHRSLGGV